MELKSVGNITSLPSFDFVALEKLYFYGIFRRTISCQNIPERL